MLATIDIKTPNVRPIAHVRISSGILGPIAFNKNGDVTANPVTIYLVKGGKPTTYQVIVPVPSLVAAA